MFKKLIVSKTARRRVSWIIAGVLIFPFILFFHSSARGPARGPGGDAGILFGHHVPWEAFEEEQRVVRTEMELQLGQIPEGLLPMITQTTWERLMLAEEAAREHVRVDDRELAAYIEREIPAFQNNGRFAPRRYQEILQRRGHTPQSFEALVRRDLLIKKLLDGVRSGVAVTDDEVNAAYVQAHERLRVSLLSKDPGMFLDAVAPTITEQDLRAAYDAHPDEVRMPEQITFEYMGLTRDELLKNLTATEDAIAGYYESHQDEWLGDNTQPKPLADVRDHIRGTLLNEQAHHRLIALAVDLDDALKHNATFDDIIKTQGLAPRTVGPVAADNPLTPGGPEPALVQAAAGLGERKLSEVVETDNGVYVLRVTHREPSRIPPFEAVRQHFKEQLTTTRARDAARKSASDLRDALAKKLADTVSFEEACQGLAVTPTGPAPFNRTDPIQGLGPAQHVVTAAFATPVGQLTQVLDAGSRQVILFIHERLAADASGVTDAERGTYREQALNEKRQHRVAEWLADVRAHAKLQSFVEPHG